MKDIDIAKFLNETWDAFKNNWVLFVVSTLIMMVVPNIVILPMAFQMQGTAAEGGAIPGMALGYVAIGLLYLKVSGRQ